MQQMELMANMLEKQEALNALTAGENWVEKNLNFRRQIVLEGAELINSMAPKWWSKEDIDLPNAKIEAIDMLHFALSVYLVDFNGDSDQLESSFGELYAPVTTAEGEIDKERVIRNTERVMLSSLGVQDAVKILEDIFVLCMSLALNGEDIFKLYVGKGVLNKFRQEHGYADGTYIKMWDGGTTEDNVFMLESLFSIPLGEDFEDELYEHLEVAYAGRN